jgi:hypothetical protein
MTRKVAFVVIAMTVMLLTAHQRASPSTGGCPKEPRRSDPRQSRGDRPEVMTGFPLTAAGRNVHPEAQASEGTICNMELRSSSATTRFRDQQAEILDCGFRTWLDPARGR